jgi:hypothetical protein
MRPRIQRNLIASSNTGSRADEMAAHNRREYNKLQCQSTSSITTEDSRPYTIIWGVKVILGASSITLEDCKKANLRVYNI